MIDNFLKDAANWFITIKVPDLKDKVNNALTTLDKGGQLEGNYKKLFGFILFDYSMHKGPSSFFIVEKIAEEINVTEEFKHYANDWINYSKTNKNV